MSMGGKNGEKILGAKRCKRVQKGAKGCNFLQAVLAMHLRIEITIKGMIKIKTGPCIFTPYKASTRQTSMFSGVL
jgi:hypothetical protein